MVACNCISEIQALYLSNFNKWVKIRFIILILQYGAFTLEMHLSMGFKKIGFRH